MGNSCFGCEKEKIDEIVLGIYVSVIYFVVFMGCQCPSFHGRFHVPCVSLILDLSIFVSVDNILLCSKSIEEQREFLRIVLEILMEKKLYDEFSQCEVWFKEVYFLGRVP